MIPITPRYCNEIIRAIRGGEQRVSRISLYHCAVLDHDERDDFAQSVRLLLATRRITIDEPYPGFIYLDERVGE